MSKPNALGVNVGLLGSEIYLCTTHIYHLCFSKCNRNYDAGAVSVQCPYNVVGIVLNTGASCELYYSLIVIR